MDQMANMSKRLRTVIGAVSVVAGMTIAGGVVARAQSSAAPAKPVVIEVQVDKVSGEVSPSLYGLMTEEINHAFDGGLYAELVRNRTMRPNWDGINQWVVVTNGDAAAEMSGDDKTGPSEALPNSLKLKVDRADPANLAGVRNEGYWGMAVRPATTYHGSFYAKADDVFLSSSGKAAVTVSLVNDVTGKAEATATVPALSGTWARYEYELKTGAVTPSAANHLFLTVDHPGSVWFNLVSLFPPTFANRANGNRADLMEKLAAMHPQFLRFPGGNYLEGDHVAERFQWKQTIGPLVDRPTHKQPWGYPSSDGMGLLEFLEWCEDLHMRPVLAVYAGYSMAQDVTKPGPALEPYVADALDELEYVTGSADTKWGAQRVKDGHPAPFDLTYVEIGNEDEFDKSGLYDGRFTQFYSAIKKKYPALQLIATAPVTSVKPDVIDDHYYRTAAAMMADAGHYDKTDRNGPKIFVGEWATIEGVPTPNFNAALADAAWMTGMERNSDIVIMAAYAPLFVNVNPQASQWGTNLIGYNAIDSYGSPTYWLHVLFGGHLGTEIVATQATSGDATAGGKLFYSVTKDAAKGKVFLKVVNAGSDEQAVEFDFSGVTGLEKRQSVYRLSAVSVTDTNSITERERIVPKKITVEASGKALKQRLPGYSISVFDVDVN
jgi:alpha-N-arabinofuranosidase